MAFQPSSSIYIGTVPFNPNYRDVRYIPGRQEQEQYFLGLCPLALRRDDYTYQRVDNSVVVPYNAEELYGYNYCMFKNANYGDRWFYSFITNIEYVNPGASRLTLATDIMQTWFPDLEVQPCFVEREHVDDDAIGAHIKDEGFDPGELKCTYYSFDNQNQFLYPVIASAAEPLKDGTYVNVGGDVYNGVYSGCSLTVFLSVDEMKQFIQALADNGQQDAISAIYLVPDYLTEGKVKKDNGWGYWLPGGARTPKQDYTLNIGMGELDGYVPKNNKTLIYPNQYLEVTNFNGQTQNFRLEFFETPGVASFDKTGGCTQQSTLAYIPKGYNGNAGRSVENAVYMAGFPTCSWVYQAFANQMGQSEMEVLGFKLNSMSQLPFLQTGINGAQSVLGSLVDVNSSYTAGQGNIALSTTPVGAAVAGANAIAAGIKGVTGAIGGAVDSLQGMLQIEANLQRASRTPNTSRGGLNSTSSLVNIGSYTVGFRKYACRAEIAKQIDDYYSVYGYLVNELKVPNITGRQSWNYVKTNGATVAGKAPAPVLTAINRLLDGGITFWHTDDVGNYGLPNAIV